MKQPLSRADLLRAARAHYDLIANDLRFGKTTRNDAATLRSRVDSELHEITIGRQPQLLDGRCG